MPRRNRNGGPRSIEAPALPKLKAAEMQPYVAPRIVLPAVEQAPPADVTDIEEPSR